MDVDLRKVRYFVTVAECNSFRRASEVLRVAQPALSRQIRALEQELGLQLFTRTAQGVKITVAGRELLDDARVLLRSSSVLVRRARRAADAPEQLTIAFRSAIPITSIVRKTQDRFPGLSIDVHMTVSTDQSACVLDGRVDACFARSPIVVDGLESLLLYAEPRVVAVAVGHPLAAKDSIEFEDALEVQVLQPLGEVPELSMSHTQPQTHETRIAEKLPEAQVVDRFEYVASGLGILVIPESVAAFYHRVDVTYRRADWAGPSEVSLVYPPSGSSPALIALIEIAQEESRVRALR